MSSKKAKKERTPSRRKAGNRNTMAAEAARRKSPAPKSSRTPAIHCTVAPVADERLLLPTNVIEEIAEYVEPRPMESTPEWLLGQVDWNDRQVPVFSYAALISGGDPEEADSHSRIMVIKSLVEDSKVPYLGVLISEIPSLEMVGREDIEHLGDDRVAMGVFSRVKVGETGAIIPDIDRLAHLVEHAAFGALPITEVSH